jgi:hypothetical protein
VLSVFAESGFSGSSLLPRSKPGETRLLRFGRDLDVELARELRGQRSEPKLYSFEDGELSEHSLRYSQLAFVMGNKSLSGRTLCATLNVTQNARIDGADAAGYDTALERAVLSFQLPAKTSITREVRITESVRTPIAAVNATAAFLKHAASTESVHASQRPILARAAEQMRGAEIARGSLARYEAELEQLRGDLSRLEGHVRALGSSSDEGERAAERLRLAEDRFQRLRQRVAVTSREVAECDARARQILSGLGKAKPLNGEQHLREAPHGG